MKINKLQMVTELQSRTQPEMYSSLNLGFRNWVRNFVSFKIRWYTICNESRAEISKLVRDLEKIKFQVRGRREKPEKRFGIWTLSVRARAG